MRKNVMTTERFISEAIVQAQLLTNRLTDHEVRMYARVREDFRDMGVAIEDLDPIVDSVVLSQDTTVENEMDSATAAFSETVATEKERRMQKKRELTLRVETEEFATAFLREVTRNGRLLADVRDSHVTVAADTALRAFDPYPDLVALGRMVGVLSATYRKYQKLQVTANASERDITSSLRREVVTVLRARGPYSGADGHRISMQ